MHRPVQHGPEIQRREGQPVMARHIFLLGWLRRLRQQRLQPVQADDRGLRVVDAGRQGAAGDLAQYLHSQQRILVVGALFPQQEAAEQLLPQPVVQSFLADMDGHGRPVAVQEVAGPAHQLDGQAVARGDLLQAVRIDAAQIGAARCGQRRRAIFRFPLSLDRVGAQIRIGQETRQAVLGVGMHPRDDVAQPQRAGDMVHPLHQIAQRLDGQ